MGGLTRRSLLSHGVALGGAAALGVPATAAAARGAPARRSAGTVLVLGGGIGGLTAAHELAERGFAVTVLERKELGGKARSIPVPGTGSGGRPDLPGEHGFRFFPGWYRNLPDTLRRIPFPGNRNGVHDNLVSGSVFRLSRMGTRFDLFVPLKLALPSLDPVLLLPALIALLDTGLRLPPWESAHFANRLVVYLTSGDERRLGQWERTAWWDFLGAGRMSQEYQRIFGIGFTRMLVAARAEEASTHTVGLFTEAFFNNLLGRGNDGPADRVLNAPTNEAWIDPWLAHLRSLGVRFETGAAERLHVSGGRISGVTVRTAAGSVHVSADHYISAVPAERSLALWGPEVLAADPRLRLVGELRTEWMNGLMFYLRRKLPLVHGHVSYLDTPWSLTSVSQAQFWRGGDLTRYGDGGVRDCLSVIISNWEAPGIVHGKPARFCTKQQLFDEVWAQLSASLEDTGEDLLRPADLHSWFLDPAITGLGSPGGAHSEEPLLINPVGSWALRPEAATAIPNLFLAADYVRNIVNLATMEGANEAGRLAANAVLDETGSSAPRARLFTLFRAPELRGLQEEDTRRYRAGLPNLFDQG
ncbi:MULTISPECIES: hydroxysqualene dehydroxylase [unclassified Crossiella]|uniref:hydroxysqualene dehydroxylase n=1 Tax=unclassified Crossiella TaxID=2620835 RepID=UPI001FFF27F0|nr:MULTISPECIES: FAD-dependent oxidoreductase [unclassified Crossiella]MCK2243005.1 FAD-dependent oxidoreductase [Crossiella sp. S99.2]MCK2256882.1 FAD-dependent oxidoreductase [Crossiella sp. S99.1]